MKRILRLLLAIPLVASAERELIWPDGKMPDAQPHQIAAMTDVSKKNEFNADEWRHPYIEWFAPPQKPNGCCMILVSGGSYRNCCDVGLIRIWNERLSALGCQCVNFVYRTPWPEGMPFYATAWQDAQRGVFRDAHGCGRVLELRGQGRVDVRCPVDGFHRPSDFAGKPFPGQVMGDSAQPSGNFGLPGRAPAFVEVLSVRAGSGGVSGGFRSLGFQPEEQAAQPEGRDFQEVRPRHGRVLSVLAHGEMSFQFSSERICVPAFLVSTFSMIRSRVPS